MKPGLWLWFSAFQDPMDYNWVPWGRGWMGCGFCLQLSRSVSRPTRNQGFPLVQSRGLDGSQSLQSVIWGIQGRGRKQRIESSRGLCHGTRVTLFGWPFHWRFLQDSVHFAEGPSLILMWYVVVESLFVLIQAPRSSDGTAVVWNPAGSFSDNLVLWLPALAEPG